eukprot:5762511-Prymnesium_polylepis.1
MAILDILFILDFLLGFRTAYILENLVIRRPRLVARRYLRGWFLLDLIAAIPLDLIAAIDADAMQIRGEGIQPTDYIK